jgi:hypothetical protein
VRIRLPDGVYTRIEWVPLSDTRITGLPPPSTPALIPITVENFGPQTELTDPSVAFSTWTRL